MYYSFLDESIKLQSGFFRDKAIKLLGLIQKEPTNPAHKMNLVTLLIQAKQMGTPVDYKILKRLYFRHQLPDYALRTFR